MTKLRLLADQGYRPPGMESVERRLGRPGSILLEGEWGESAMLFEQPLETLVVSTLGEVDAALRELDRATDSGYYVAGALSYESSGAWVGESRVHPSSGPLAWFGIYSGFTRFHNDALETVSRFNSIDFLDERVFRDQVSRIRELIADGDVYQINLTGKFSGVIDSALGLYGMMRRHNAPYRAWLNLGSLQIVSASPELFFRREGTRITTRPMKGTAARAPEVEADDRIARHLFESEKDRAENVMIVDLLRNDLGSIAEPGTVAVKQLFEVETHRTVHQMTSTIEAELAPGTEWQKVFHALFPCGSITGAPKLRAMERIREIEHEPRGFYCGAIGFAAPGEQGCFNVAIRTCTVGENGVARAGVGSGIVWDSEPATEYAECRTKTRFLEPVAWVGLFETMRAEDGRVELIDYHWARFSKSARYLGIPVDKADFERVVCRAATREPSCVVRVELRPDGEIGVTVRAPPAPVRSWRLAITNVVADPADFRFFHKTTDREAYDTAEQQARAAGFDEGVLLNPMGEVTEGSRTSVWIERDGAWLTPPLAAGLLPGVHRAFILDTVPGAREQTLTVQELLKAEKVYCGNAVQGLIAVSDVEAIAFTTSRR